MVPVTVHMAVAGYRFRQSRIMSGDLYMKHEQMHGTVVENLTESLRPCLGA